VWVTLKTQRDDQADWLPEWQGTGFDPPGMRLRSGRESEIHFRIVGSQAVIPKADGCQPPEETAFVLLTAKQAGLLVVPSPDCGCSRF
jgi:hypothetical protein